MKPFTRRFYPAGATVVRIVGPTLAALLAACSGKTAAAPPLPDPAEVIAVPAEIRLAAGGEAQLAAQANDSAGRPMGGARFRFSPTDTRMLRVSELGRVTSLGPATDHTAVIIASGRRERRVPVVITPGPPQRFEKLTGDGQKLRVGEAPAIQLSAMLVDAWGNPLAGVPMSVDMASEGVAPGEVASGGNGEVLVDLPKLTKAGSFIVKLRPKTSEVPTASFALSVLPGPPATIRLLNLKTEPDASSAKVAKFAFRVTDQYDNPVPGESLSVRTSKGDREPILARTDATGTANIELPLSRKPQQRSLEADLANAADVRAVFQVKIPGASR